MHESLLWAVAFAQTEFLTVDDAFYHKGIESFFGDLLQGAFNQRIEGGLVFGIGILNGNLHYVLLVVADPGVNIFTDACILQGSAQGSRFVVHEGFGQNIQGHNQALVGSEARYYAVRQEGLVVGAAAFGYTVYAPGCFLFTKGSLQGHFNFCIGAFVARKVAFVQKGQFLVQVGIAIKQYKTVGGMVILLMKGNEVLVGQFGNGSRVATGRNPIGVVGEQQLIYLVAEFALGTGIGTFHFVINHPFVNDFAVDVVQLVMPAFLLQDIGVGIYQRLKHGIHIYVHEVKVVFIVHAGYRVGGKVGPGHGI